MNTNDFSAAARAEGRARADEWMAKNGGPQTTGHHIAHTSIISGFRQGAQWGRVQEPTDAEVDAAARALHAALEAVHGTAWDDLGKAHRERWSALARAALFAARQAIAAAALAEGGEVA